MTRLFVFLGVTALLTAAAPAQPPQKSDHERLQGKWEVVASASPFSKVAKATPPGTLFMTFSGDKLTTEQPKSGIGPAEPNPFRLHTGTNPRQIDITFKPLPKVGDDKPRPAYGVYQLEGDTLKLCYKLSPTGGPAAEPKPEVLRPKAVEPGQGSYYELKRVPQP